VRQKGLQFLIAVDQVFNTLVGNGWADETLSARAYRNHNKSKPWAVGMKVIDFIFFWQQNHCQIAHQREVTRSQLPVEYRP